MSAAEWRALLLFGPVWYAITTVPLIVTYQSPRHLYLPSAGAAVALGVLIWAGWPGRLGWRAAWPAAASAALVAALAVRLAAGNQVFADAGTLSERGVTQVEELAAWLPERSAVVMLMPGSYGNTWFWMWSLPYAVEPPFGHGRLYARHEVIEHPSTYCCPNARWWSERRETLRRWLARDGTLTIHALTWNGHLGVVDHTPRTFDVAELRAEVEAILGRPLDEAETIEDGQIDRLVLRLVGH